jgi:hypothetical protein
MSTFLAYVLFLSSWTSQDTPFTCIELREINAARLIDYREVDSLLREILAMKMVRSTWTLFVTQQWAMESSSFRLLQAGSGYDQLGSSRVCKDARIFMKVASKKFLLFKIQFNHLCLLCAYWNSVSQAIWDTLLWGLAQVIINCIQYF